jgi:hypothetical protein
MPLVVDRNLPVEVVQAKPGREARGERRAGERDALGEPSSLPWE